MQRWRHGCEGDLNLPVAPDHQMLPLRRQIHFLFLLYLYHRCYLQKDGSDLDMTGLWLKNVYLLHDLLTQHSLKEVKCGNIHHITDRILNPCCCRHHYFSDCESDELVPPSTNLSDLIRALSDLCIQAYQQLLSITEKRLYKIKGAVTLVMCVLYPPLLLFHLLPVFPP